MNRPANSMAGISKQRGFWLRCFLEPIWLIAAFLVAAAHAQVEVPAPFHLAHVRGVFVDEKGNPIAGAAVTLDRDDKVIGSATTDRAGRFEIKHVTGHYWLHVKKPGYSVVGREVVVGEAATYLFGERLYMIAGPGACSDDCSQVFTSKSKFDKAISKNTGHQD
jgi:hypothetical protein